MRAGICLMLMFLCIPGMLLYGSGTGEWEPVGRGYITQSPSFHPRLFWIDGKLYAACLEQTGSGYRPDSTGTWRQHHGISRLKLFRLDGGRWQLMASKAKDPYTSGAFLHAAGGWHLLEDNILYRLEGTAWHPVSGKVIGHLPDGFVNAGTRYLAYSGTFYALEKPGNAMAVRKLTGSSWSLVGAGNVTAEAMFPALFAHAGVPYVAYNTFPKPGSGKPFQLEVQRFSGGSWQLFGTPVPIVKSFIETPALAFRDSNVYLACPTGRERRMGVYRLSPGGRSPLGGLVSRGQSQYAHLFWAEGVLHLVFRDWDAGMKNSVYRYSGGRWELIGARGFSLDGQSTTEVQGLAAPDGTLYAVFLGKGQRMAVMRHLGR